MPRGWPRRRAGVWCAAVLVLLGVLATAARLDAPSDPAVLRLGWSTWRADGVVVDVPAALPSAALRSGELVTTIAGHPLSDPPGGLPRPAPGAELTYVVDGVPRTVVVQRPAVSALIMDGWGNLVFVLALGGLALALYARRPEERATTGLLVGSAGLLGSTLVVVAGLSPLTVATGGPGLWLFHLGVVVVYAAGWGGFVAMSLLLVPDHPWLRRRPQTVLAAAYGGAAAVLTLWGLAVVIMDAGTPYRLALVHAGTTVVVAVAQLTSVAAGVVGYRSCRDRSVRIRLRWLAVSSAVAIAIGLLGWELPELITGAHPLPAGAIGLAGLPFVVGLAVALRRHQLFDIERLVNRSLVYGAVVAALVGGYAVLVAVLTTGLRLSGTVAAAAAAAAAALGLAPLRGAAQRTVNRMMYGHRDEPTRVLDNLGGRLQAVQLPSELLPTAVRTIADSLRVPFVAVDVTDEAGGYRRAAEHGTPIGEVHDTPLVHVGETVGRLQVSARGQDDPLEPADLALIGSLAQQIGPAVQAVRLHEDLLRSRAAVVASREDERRRLRRDLHDGLGPSLAAIRLKAGLAARGVPEGTAARALLGEIDTEVSTSIADVRRVVEALRPPALDELGLLAAIRARADSLQGDLQFEVNGPAERLRLPAAVETAAYRIAVEAITNAARHSQARRCAVTISPDSDQLAVLVCDDGVGLDPARPAHVGLRSMQERAAEIGGRCRVRTADSGGTEVLATLPLEIGAR